MSSDLLFQYIEESDVENVLRLIENGVDVNALDQRGETKGLTPLLLAIQKSRPDISGVLIDKGADVNAEIESGPHTGLTPLLFSIEHERPSVFRALTENGADVNARVNRGRLEGYTPLMMAAHLSDNRIIRELQRRGASTDDIFNLEGMDTITFEEYSVGDYLKMDPLNFVILEGKKVIFTNVKNLQNNMEDAIVLRCFDVGYISPSNVVHDEELFNSRKMGTTSGYFDAPSLRDAMGLVVRENKRIFRLSKSITTIPAVVSQLAFEGRTSLVGANHCQGGAEEMVRMVELVDLNDIPMVNSTVGSIEIQREASMLANSYLIVKRSRVKTEYAEKVREMVMREFRNLMAEDRMTRYSTNVGSGILEIRSDKNIKYLTNLCRVFKPDILEVVVHASGILDYSFLHDMNMLSNFTSTVKTNTRSAFAHLRKHTRTLETISMPIDTAIVNLYDYDRLREVRFSNFDNEDNVIEALAFLTNVERVELESSRFNGSIEDLWHLGTPRRTPLRELTLKFSRFVGDLTPLEELTKLESLELFLPRFEGSMAPLKKMKNLKRLKLTTLASIDLELISVG